MGVSFVLGVSALLPAGLGFRNKIINGDFGINQRNVTTTTSGGTFVFDRWMQWAADGTSTFSSESFAVGNAISDQEPIKYAQIITSGQSAVGAQSNIQQRVEDVRTCAGQQVVVSFWAKAGSGTPKIAVEIEQNFGSGGSAVVNYYGGFATISTTWARYSVALTVPSVAGKTIGTSSFMALNLWVSSGSTNGFRNGSMGIQNNTFQFWGVQLEQNYQLTPFEQRPIGVELALCQRYYFRHTTNAVNGIVGSGVSENTTDTFFITYFPTQMRTVPTSVESSTLELVLPGVADYAFTSLALASSSSTTFVGVVSIGGSVGLTASRPYFLRANNSAAAYLAFSAEL